MSSNLLDSLSGLITPEVVSAASRQLGDSEGAISKGLGASFSSILLGLLSKAGSPEALRPAFDLISNPANDPSVLDDPRQLLVASSSSPIATLGGNFLGSIFGSRLSSITNAVGNTSGLRGSSAASMINLAAPLVMGVLGSRVRKGRLDPTGLSDLLFSQRDSIMAAAPAGVSTALGIGEIPRVSTPHVVETPRAGSRNRWLWPALAALALIAVLWGLTRNRGTTTQAALDTAGSVTGAVTSSVSEGASEVAAFVKRKLPRKLINAPERGTESSLIVFIEDASEARRREHLVRLRPAQFRDRLRGASPQLTGTTPQRRDHFEGVSQGRAQDRRLHQQHRGTPHRTCVSPRPGRTMCGRSSSPMESSRVGSRWKAMGRRIRSPTIPRRTAGRRTAESRCE